MPLRPSYGMRSCLIDKASYSYEFSQPAYVFAPEPSCAPSATRSRNCVADLQVPIGCVGVAVYPGDVIVGDADGQTVVPAHFAVEMVDICEKQDDIEHYLAMRIASGDALWGGDPPSPQVYTDYEAWVKAGRSPIEPLPQITLT